MIYTIEEIKRIAAYGGLYADLREALNKELDMVTTTGAEEVFLSRIRMDEVPLYVRVPDRNPSALPPTPQQQDVII